MKFRIGNRVLFNKDWDRNVHLGGRAKNPESESEIPGGTTGVVLRVEGDVCVVQTSFGEAVAHFDYLDPLVAKRHSC